MLKKNFQLLEIAEKTDANISNRRINYYSIEGCYPIFANRAKGAYLWDIDNNKYLDFILGYGTIILGHSDPLVNTAVIKELSNGNCISPLVNPIEYELCNLLVNTIPNSEMAFLMKTGSDATSGCIRLARAITNRDIIIRYGYNGWHDWSTPKQNGVPDCVKSLTIINKEYNNIEALSRIFIENKDKVAAVIMMPFETELPNKNYLHQVKELAQKNGALFILDEMRTGFRISNGGAQEYFNIEADLATYSKAMANGYPISAIVGKKQYLDYIKTTKMTATYFGSTPSMAAAKETIQIIKNNNVIDYITTLGNHFSNTVKQMINSYNIPAKFIGFNTMPFVEFVGENKEQIKKYFFKYCIKNGILLHPNHHWYISSSHTLEDINFALMVIDNAMKGIRKVI